MTRIQLRTGRLSAIEPYRLRVTRYLHTDREVEAMLAADIKSRVRQT